MSVLLKFFLIWIFFVLIVKAAVETVFLDTLII